MKMLLPNWGWLVTNGYSGLCGAIRRHPKLFAHIPQERKRSAPEEHVAIAESLAKMNGGTLQNSQWLVTNGYSALYAAMYVHPKLFAHIPQERKRSAPEEHVAIAESLAKKNGGTLQNRLWLQKNDYIALDAAIYNHPKLFAHIPRERKIRSPEENVSLAEKLAKKNGGTLQNSKWLRKNGYCGLYHAIRNHPKLFAHIPQDFKGGRSLEESVSLAEKLAKKNGGMLQNCEWLRKNGYTGLDQAIRIHPKAFKHIKQLRLRVA